MEALKERFDALQEGILSHYELESNNLSDHVEYWSKVRQENVILFYARDKGLKHLGMLPVPVAQVAQERARQAIAMHLVTQSLLDSPYGGEDWTLQDVSREQYRCPPKNCFKKGGHTVEVCYDCKEDNTMHYTAWDAVYCQDADGTWQRCRGGVDTNGLYYIKDDEQIYYVLFEDDAAKYSKSGLYEVHTKTGTLTKFHPVSSSTPTTSRAGRESGGRAEAVLQGSGRSRRGTEGPSAKRRRERRPPAITEEDGIPPGLGGVPERSPSPRAGSEPRRAPSPSPAATATGGRDPVDPRRYARRSEHRHNTGNRQLPAPTVLAPVLILRGPSNSVKCLRYRWHRQHRHFFEGVTTTLRWLKAGGTDRGGTAEVILRFDSDSQRQEFLDSGAVPPTLSFVVGDMPFFG